MKVRVQDWLFSAALLAVIVPVGAAQTKPPVDYVNPYIGSPIFDEIKIQLENGRVFTIRAATQSPHNKFIQSAALNGRELNKPWFSHADIAEGGTLVLEMGPRPNKSWGSAPAAAPPSMSQP